MSFDTFVQIAGWVVTGAIAGYAAGILLKAERQGCLTRVLIGIAGAFVGGLVMNVIMPGGLIPGIDFLNTILNAIFGSVILLIAMEIILPGKQLGISEGDDRGGRRRRR